MCVLHIKPFLLPVDIQHFVCPCRLSKNSREIQQAMWPRNYNSTEILHCYAVSRADDATPRHRRTVYQRVKYNTANARSRKHVNRQHSWCPPTFSPEKVFAVVAPLCLDRLPPGGGGLIVYVPPFPDDPRLVFMPRGGPDDRVPLFLPDGSGSCASLSVSVSVSLSLSLSLSLPAPVVVVAVVAVVVVPLRFLRPRCLLRSRNASPCSNVTGQH